jgi:hypothetical protein
VAWIGGPILAVVLAAWITWPAWGAAPFSGVDVVAHILRVTFGLEHIFARGRLDGWSPTAFLGHQHYLFRGPGLSLLVAAVRVATLGLLPIVPALNLAVIGCFVTFPLTVAFAASSLGLCRRGAGLAAILALLVSDPFGVGISGLFGDGLLENQVGSVAFFLALGALVRVAVDPRPRWILFGAGALAALLVSHLLSTLVLALFASLYVPWVLSRHGLVGAVGRLLVCGLLAAGLAAFWLLPFLAHRDLRGAVARPAMMWLGDTVRAVARGDLLFRPRVLWVVLAGWVFVLGEALGGRFRVLGLVVVPFLYMMIANVAVDLLHNDVALQLVIRGKGYAAVLATLPLARLMAALVVRLGSFGDALALTAAAALVVQPIAPLRAMVRPSPEPISALQAAAPAIARLVPRGARFATQWALANVAGVGVGAADRWLSWKSGRNSLTGLSLESTSTPWVIGVPEQLAKVPPEQSADRLARLGVTHVIAPSPAVLDRLTASPRFALAWHLPPIAILTVEPRAGHPPPSSLLATDAPATARLRSAEAEHLVIKLYTRTPGAGSVAVAWSPKWHATVNGIPVSVRRTPDGLIALDLPAGVSWLVFDYRPDTWDRLGATLTLATLLGIILVCAVDRRRGRCARRAPAAVTSPK